jgi:hypothetical protein
MKLGILSGYVLLLRANILRGFVMRMPGLYRITISMPTPG